MTFEIRSVSRVFGVRAALKSVSLTLRPGEPVAILGRSGSGKSTLLRILAGLDAPSAGDVFLNGTLVSKPGRVLVPPHKRGISMVFQDLALWPSLSVLGNVMLGLAGLRLSSREKLTRAREALAICSIEHLAGRKPGRISGGEEQRAALARAVAVRPAFLLLDEPFSGLDLVTKVQIINEIKALSTSQGMTVVLVTHDPLDAVSLCRSAFVLEDGAVTEEGSLETLLRAPRSGLLAAFKTRIEATPGRREASEKGAPQPRFPGQPG